MQYAAAFLIVIVTLLWGTWAFLSARTAVTKLGPLQQQELTTGEHNPFDIAKVQPDGTSVFAGRAAPNSLVTVLADDEPIGTASTDLSGNWLLTVERPLPGPHPKLSIKLETLKQSASTPIEQRIGGASSETAAPLSSAQPPSVPNVQQTGGETTVAAVMAGLIGDLQRRVERARTNADERGGGSKSKPAQLSADYADASVDEAASRVHRREGGAELGKHNTALTPNAAKLAAANPDQGSRAAAVKDEPDIVPVPIKFVFREAVFTEDGGKAAQLLLEYVLLEKLPSLRLTGHADERGTSDFNLKLSADRLTTVANFLRAGGYAGKLELIPKGDTEPFVDVNRSLFTREQLYDLDRRVELHLAD